MHVAEKLVFSIRHNKYLESREWFWTAVRPSYDALVNFVARKGLERKINGSDCIRVLPSCRTVAENYEPEVWRKLMALAKPGAVIADVGAFVGLYTVALAKRVGPTGSVYSFEPNAATYQVLKQHIDLNGVRSSVKAIQAAVGRDEGFASFNSNFDQSAITGLMSENSQPDTSAVRCIRLDSFFAKTKIDLMKIDVEGYEGMVLEGAFDLLKDPDRSPRAIFIEVHPYAWPPLGTSSQSLLDLLTTCNYEVVKISGEPVDRIDSYGEVVALKIPDLASAKHS